MKKWNLKEKYMTNYFYGIKILDSLTETHTKLIVELCMEEKKLIYLS